MKWIYHEPDSSAIRDIEEELGLLPSIASVLVKSGYGRVADAEKFLTPKLSHVLDPFLVPNLEAAANRIVKAIDRRERISICGDYDVDGVTSTTLLVSILRQFGLSPDFFIPRRKDEGYGMSPEIVKRILSHGVPELFLALDCGTNATEEVRTFRELGCDAIIVDHHRSKTTAQPDAILVNPNSAFAAAPEFSALCTAGLIFKVIHGVLKLLRSRNDERAFKIVLKEYLDLVAMGTITDISPLVGENRTMTWFGLKQLRNTKREGLKALVAASNIADTADILPVDVSHRIGPRINASGRLADASLPVEMFLCSDAAKCRRYADELNEMNRNRQEIERAAFEEALAQVKEYGTARNALLACGNWHTGVVGIIAGKLARMFNRPCIVLGIEGKLAKGSGRSVEGVNLIEVLKPFGDEILEAWGGHPMAVGVTVEVARVGKLRELFDKSVGEFQAANDGEFPEENLEIAAWLKTADLTSELFDQIAKLYPFGEGNPEPVFGLRNVAMPAGAIKFGEENFRFQLVLPSLSRLGVVAWHKAAAIPPAGMKVDLAMKLAWNNYNGRKYLQAELVDWRPAQAQ
ncbi:MAG: single-stranded-DNA-specific exonuclease RecJ [Opitutae bacterium]|nr:single-stranded-DNA-specific exonuclease RecJ [Opitutae bacterium]